MPRIAPQPQSPVRSSRPERPSSAFACLWVADLPTWCLERLEPELVGQPVIAVDGGRVTGVNSLARWAGVRPGDSLARARELCPLGAFKSLEPSQAAGVWQDTLEFMNRHTPWLESPRPGLIYASGLSPEDAALIARDLHLRLGMGGSREAALLAALSAREGEARLEPHQTRFLEAVPLRIVRGAGVRPETIERLRLFGISTLGDLKARVSRAQLERQFPEDAERLWNLAHGLDRRAVPVHQPPAGFTARLELESPALEPAEVLPALERLISQATAHLERHLAGALVLRLETAQGWRSHRQHLKALTRDEKTLRRAARKALPFAQAGLEITALELCLTDLSKPIPTQDSLFAVLERPGVRAAVQTVHRRFPDRLGRLKITNPRAYLPERRFRFVPLSGEERAKAPSRKGKR